MSAWPDTPEAERDALIAVVKDLVAHLAGGRGPLGAKVEGAFEILHRIPSDVLAEHTRRQKLAREREWLEYRRNLEASREVQS
jgi:hypothetical protein